MKEYLWTADGGRLEYQSSHETNMINWLFLPGGPGLGSEALAKLTQLLKDKIPGVIWHLDLPNDGSNILKDKSITNWRSVITQAVKAFEKTILVAHSTPGMYVQTMPELEELLYGCVLIGTAPNASWQKTFVEYCKNNTDANITSAEKEYMVHPNNESLRKLLIAAAKYCFVTEKSLTEGKELFAKIPVNHLASEEASIGFDSEKYQATWIPKITTLITTGSDDHITPINLYSNNPEYKQKNFLIREILGAGHYPWYENPSAVTNAFQDYVRKLYSYTGL
jgi:pimeloyl-ACP methyl ester carboxylesterase